MARVAFSLLSRREIKVLFDGRKQPGRHAVTWDGSNNSGQKVATGVYFIRMRSSGFSEVRKALLIK